MAKGIWNMDMVAWGSDGFRVNRNLAGLATPQYAGENQVTRSRKLSKPSRATVIGFGVVLVAGLVAMRLGVPSKAGTDAWILEPSEAAVIFPGKGNLAQVRFRVANHTDRTLRILGTQAC